MATFSRSIGLGAHLLGGLLCVAAISPAPAFAAVSGSALIQVDASEQREQAASSNEIKLSTIHGFVEADEPDTFHLVLGDGSVDGAGLAKAPDRKDWMEERLKTGGRAVWIQAHPDGSVNVFTYYVDGESGYFSGTAGEVYGLKRDGDRLSGHYVLYTSFFGKHFGVDATFETTLITPPKAKPMAAADLAAAGKAYLAQVEVLKGDDVDAIGASLDPERRAAFEAERGKPDFAAMLGFLKAMQPKTVKIVSGSDYGDWSELAIAGTESDDSPFTGTVEVRRDGGGWKVGKTSTRSGDAAASPDSEARTWEPPEPDAVPALATQGFAATPLNVDDTPFQAVDAIAVHAPATLGDARYLVIISDTKLIPAQVHAFWTQEANNADALFGGQGRVLALLMDLDSDNELDKVEVRLSRADNSGDELWGLESRAIKFGDRIAGMVEQSEYDETAGTNVMKGAVRFDLPVRVIE